MHVQAGELNLELLGSAEKEQPLNCLRLSWVKALRVRELALPGK
jgi:hypothetical protein